MEDFSIAECPQRRLSVKEAARMLGITTGTLHNWRTDGEGPVYYKEDPEIPTSRVWYFLCDVLKWLEENRGKRVDPTAQKSAEDCYVRQKAS